MAGLRLRLELPGGGEYACWAALVGRPGLPLPGSAASAFGEEGRGVRLWFLASASVRAVSDLAAEITEYLWPAGDGGRCPDCGLRREGREEGAGREGASCRCANALQLSMDGFSLPHDADIRILAAGDRVRVQRKESPGSGSEPGGSRGALAGEKRAARGAPSRSARRKAEKRRRCREEKTFGSGWAGDEDGRSDAAACVPELRSGPGEALRPAGEGCKLEDLEVEDVVVFHMPVIMPGTGGGIGLSDPIRARVVDVEGVRKWATEEIRRREWREAAISAVGVGGDQDGTMFVGPACSLYRLRVVGKGPLLEPPPEASAPTTGGGGPAPVGGAPVVPTARGRRSAGVGDALRRARAP